MLIPSQLPPFVAPIRTGPLQALALQSGQVLEAKVIGPAPNGGIQVEVRGQVLNLVLPTAVNAGDTIRLQVQGAGPQMQLALQVMASPTNATPAITTPTAPLVVPPQNPAPAPVADELPLPQTQATTNQPATSPTAPTSTSPATATTQPQPTAPAGTTAQPAAAQPAAALPTVPGATSPAQPAPAAETANAALTTRTVVVTAPQATPVAPAPVASPALPNPLAVAAAAAATVPPAPTPAGPALGPVRAVIPITAVGGATTHSSSGNPLPQPPMPQPTTPQAALAQMVHSAGPQQGTVTALTTALTSIAGKVVLPEAVERAAQQVLAGRVAIDAPRFNGAALQAAVRASGIFQEAKLAQGQMPLPQTDMKSALLVLRNSLASWLGQQAPVAPVSQVPPPLRGSIPRARAAEAPPPFDPNAAPEEVGRQLLERTESSLARIRLHQHASLPDSAGKTAEWSMDLPVMVGSHQTLLHLQIHRDQQDESETATERGWQMRFAISLPEMGEVGAQVTLRAGATGVMLWATDPSASAALEAEVASLRDALANAGLRPGAVIVRHGEPHVPIAAEPSGHFVDERT